MSTWPQFLKVYNERLFAYNWRTYRKKLWGGVSEWFMVAVLKTAVLLCRTMGSNPIPSAFDI